MLGTRQLGILVILTLAIGQGVKADVTTTIAIGNICMEGVRETSLNRKNVDADGTWDSYAFALPSAPGARGAITIFARPFRVKQTPRNCAEIVADENPRGNKPVLAGALRELNMEGEVFTAVRGSNRFHVKSGMLTATLADVTSAPGLAHGGKVLLAGSQRKLSVIQSLLAQQDNASGVLEVSGNDIKFSKVRVQLPGGAAASADLVPADAKAEDVVALDLGSSQWTLIQGNYVSQARAPVRGERLDVGSATLMGPTFDAPAGGIKISAARAGINGSVAGSIAGSATSVVAGSPKLAYSLPDATGVSVSLIKFQPERRASGLIASTAVLEDLKAKSLGGSLAPPDQSALARGQVELAIASASSRHISATSKWTNPILPASAFFLPDGSVKSAHWNLAGPLDALILAGDIDGTKQQLGNILTIAAAQLKLSGAKVQTEIRIPVKVEVGNLSGSFTVNDQNQEAVLTGKLKRLRLDGTLVLNIEAGEKSRLEFPNNGLLLSVEALVATKPFVAGTKPAFGSVAVAVTNETPLKIAKDGSVGRVTLAVSTVTLGDPIIQLGAGGTLARAKLTLNSTGSGSVVVDLATQKVVLARADFAANDIEFSMLEQGVWFDLGGVHVVDPAVKLKSLKINIDRNENASMGSAEILGLELSASTIDRPRDLDLPNAISFSGSLQSPLRVASVTATDIASEDALGFRNVLVKDMSLAIGGARAEIGRQATITNATLALSLGSAQELTENGRTSRVFTDARLITEGKIEPASGISLTRAASFELAVTLNGHDDALSGSGTAKLSTLIGSMQGEMDTGFECSGGAHLKPGIEGNFAIGGPIAMAAKFDSGRAEFIGSTGPFGLAVHTKGYAGCNSKSDKHVISAEREVWTWGVCSKGFEVYKCKWSTKIPEVSVSWHFRAELLAAGFIIGFTNPRVVVADGGVHVCNVGAFAIPGIAAVGSVSPQIESNIALINDAVNLGIRVGTTAFESTMVSALASGLGWAVSVGGTAAGNLMCIK